MASFSLRMGQFSNPVATHPGTNEVEVPPPPPPGKDKMDWRREGWNAEIFWRAETPQDWARLSAVQINVKKQKQNWWDVDVGFQKPAFC